LGFEEEINRKKMVTFFQKHHELVFATAFICVGVAYMLFGRDTVTIQDLENLWPAVKDWSLGIGEHIKSLIADLTK
jgi:hypothetical protein